VRCKNLARNPCTSRTRVEFDPRTRSSGHPQEPDSRRHSRTLPRSRRRDLGWGRHVGAAAALLDFGALDAQVDIAHLAARAWMVNYRKTILNAAEQVDTSGDAYQAQEVRMEKLSTAMMAGERAVDLATRRYNRGLTDFLDVVDAEREFYDLQERYAVAQVAVGEQFVQLYKSLGGGWQNYQAVPAIRRPQPAIIAAFRRALSSSAP
jgi:outer membrane protein TolC